jgi:hypothetical protein
MDFKFDKRKNKKDKERRNKEFNGKYSQKHIRIQEKEQENHLKNITTEKQKKTDKKGKKNKHLEN